MDALKGLEKTLNEVFVKNAPFQLPANVKKWIVQYLPYINLVLGILSLWTAWALYRWATVTDGLVDYANELSRAFGGDVVAPVERLTLVVWLAIAVLAVEGVIYILAFSPTKERKKSGWDLLFLALLVNVVYGLVVTFTDYGGPSNLISTLISTVIGLYFLFQIREAYVHKKEAKKA